jgi:hypothetical protein
MTMQTITLPLNRLRPNPVQNPTRTAPRALRGLLEEIKQSGWVAPILVCPPDDQGIHTIATGHRRFECARVLGLSTLDCAVLPEHNSTLAFIQDANGQRSVTGSDYMQMWFTDPEAIQHFPATVRAKIKLLIKWVGTRELLRLVADYKFSPSIVSEVCRTMSVISSYNTWKGEKPVNEGDILYWMLAHGQQQSARRMIKNGGGKKLATSMLRAIREGKPL